MGGETLDAYKKAEMRYKKQIINKMKQVGTYNTSFMYTINTLAKVLADYEKTTNLYERTGGQIIVKHTNKSGATNIVKNPLYQAIEKQRDDIIAYSRELGLTPAGLKRIQDKDNTSKKESRLEMMLHELTIQNPEL